MRLVTGAFVGGMAAIFGGSIVAGLSGSSAAGWILGAALGTGAGWLLWRGRLIELDRAAVSRGLVVVSAIAGVAAIVQLGRLTVFMADSSKASYSFSPASAWETGHSCVSAYYVAARAASSTSNVYADSLYTRPDDDPTQIRKAKTLGRFKIDVYEYPPTFLLLPRGLRLAAPGFDRFRLLWFGFEGAIVLLGLLAVSKFLGGAGGTRSLLFAPLVLAAVPTISTMQKGNVQQVVIAASMVAMVLFERKRWAAGGALLSFAAASKLYPGLLVLYLIARREWRAVGWTAGWGLVLLAATVVDMGADVFPSFLKHLPGLMSGEAFPAFRNPAATAINFSIPGIVFKLKLFGGPALSFGAAKILGWAYSVVAIAVTFWAARQTRRTNGEKALVWMALLIVATLRSPFLPLAYAAFPPLWLLTLLAGMAAPNSKTLALTLLGWAALSVYWPMDGGIAARGLALLSFVPQVATIVVVVLALLRRAPLGMPAVESPRAATAGAAHA
jgi:alpha-1,2-mannosyltransferase